MPIAISNFIIKPDAGGKFVVMVSAAKDGPAVLAFSDFSRDFQHHDIVQRWLRGHNNASFADLGMRVAGGGWWKLEGDLLVVYGQSAAYGRFDPAWLRERLRPGMVLNESRIDVR